ncbi:hypothetical protein AEM51_11465 [Bacteroidetes bacterium UKL13-3]|nr:hypothetical protein AEM51_11465 [Bacteroidetes bacterium UKL13-3]HCP94660.1 hypothetical protein [Bacteroidota bacterium]
MKKLERMDGELFEGLKLNELADLSGIMGAEKITTSDGDKPVDTNFTSSMGQGASVEKILADCSSYCDDSCLDTLNGASMPIIRKESSDREFIYYFNNQQVVFQ